MPLDSRRPAREDWGEGPLMGSRRGASTHGWWHTVVRNRDRRIWGRGPAPGSAAAEAGNPRHPLQRQDGRCSVTATSWARGYPSSQAETTVS